MGRDLRALAGVVLLAAMPAGVAHAADLIPASPPSAAVNPPKAEWTVELGLELRTLPHYQGSSVYGIYPFPLFDVRPAGTPSPAV